MKSTNFEMRVREQGTAIVLRALLDLMIRDQKIANVIREKATAGDDFECLPIPSPAILRAVVRAEERLKTTREVYDGLRKCIPKGLVFDIEGDTGKIKWRPGVIMRTVRVDEHWEIQDFTPIMSER